MKANNRNNIIEPHWWTRVPLIMVTRIKQHSK